jgi:hypothetical protein
MTLYQTSTVKKEIRVFVAALILAAALPECAEQYLPVYSATMPNRWPIKLKALKRSSIR